MEAYLAILREITQQFDKFELTKIPRGDNMSADALAALASTSNLAIRRVIPVEGIEKPIIDLSCKGTDLQGDNPPRIGAIVTRSKAQRATQNLDDKTDYELKDQTSPSEPPVRTRRTATISTIPEEGIHETNNEAHETF